MELMPEFRPIVTRIFKIIRLICYDNLDFQKNVRLFNSRITFVL